MSELHCLQAAGVLPLDAEILLGSDFPEDASEVRSIVAEMKSIRNHERYIGALDSTLPFSIFSTLAGSLLIDLHCLNGTSRPMPFAS